MRNASLLFLAQVTLVAQTAATVAVQTRVPAPPQQASAPQNKPEDLASVSGQITDASSTNRSPK